MFKWRGKYIILYADVAFNEQNAKRSLKNKLQILKQLHLEQLDALL